MTNLLIYKDEFFEAIFITEKSALEVKSIKEDKSILTLNCSEKRENNVEFIRVLGNIENDNIPLVVSAQILSSMRRIFNRPLNIKLDSLALFQWILDIGLNVKSMSFNNVTTLDEFFYYQREFNSRFMIL